MRNAFFSARGRTGLLLSAFALALVASVLVAPGLMAQLPNFANVQSTVASQAKPLVVLVRYGLAATCGLMGIFQCFKAAKGSAKDWLPAMLLLIVAGISLSPSTTFSMLGLPSLCTNLSQFGLC